jgi:PAS domain S-box-containing protein
VGGIEIQDRNQGERELQRVLDVVPQYVCVYDAQGRALYANGPVLEYLGLSLEHFRKDDFRARVYHPDDLERARSVREDAMHCGVGWEIEARKLRKDGQYRWFLIRGRPYRDEEGKIVRWYSSGTDINDLKQAESDIRQLVDAIATYIVVLDGEGRRLYANRAVLNYHGYTQQEFLTVDHSACFHPGDLSPTRDCANAELQVESLGKPRYVCTGRMDSTGGF